MELILWSGSAAHNLHFISFKIKLSILFFFHSVKLALLKGIKIYYNSTVIRAGIYLLSAIMKNFVLNYERQLVDSCDNNAIHEPLMNKLMKLICE